MHCYSRFRVVPKNLPFTTMPVEEAMKSVILQMAQNVTETWTTSELYSIYTATSRNWSRKQFVYISSKAMSRWEHTLKLFTHTMICLGHVDIPFMPPAPSLYICLLAKRICWYSCLTICVSINMSSCHQICFGIFGKVVYLSSIPTEVAGIVVMTGCSNVWQFFSGSIAGGRSHCFVLLEGISVPGV